MCDYEKNIDNIRKYFQAHGAERYPFENALLAEKEEYVKSLYFRMLCALVRYTGDPSEMQVLYIRRLIAGSRCEGGFEDYMKMALELGADDVDAFISVFKEDDLKYYFCLDGAILLAVMKEADKNYALLAELVDLLEILRNELEYLTKVAKAAILQSSELFDEARECATDTIEKLPMYQYVCGFYCGAIVNTPTEIHIYSSDKSLVNLSKYGTFNAGKVTIENITADLEENIVFYGCEEVVIKNCKLLGDRCRFEFTNTGKVVLENCSVDNFSNRFMHLKGCNELVVVHNHFLNCGYTEDADIRGGVIYDCDKLETIILENNTLQNCYIARETLRSNWGCTGIFISSITDLYSRPMQLLKVVGNRFIGCQCKNNGNYTEAYISARARNVVNENNLCSGAVTRIFEHYEG